MKKLTSYIVLIALLVISYTNNVLAQAGKKNQTPDAVLTAFKAKYPKANEKQWTVTKDMYTAKAKQDNSTFYATFDKNGRWVKTISKITWSWKLPANVREALKQSKYGGWRVDKLRKVEMPGEEFYQVLVDNHYLQPDADHAAFEQNYVLNFKPGGELFGEKSIESPLLF